jgi:hypothetical protein
MSTIVTRAGKGSPLTHTEVDTNFTNLNTDKLQSGDTAASLVITSADINGGTIDGATIGASSASTGAFTTATASTSFGSPVFKATSSAGGALQNSGGTTCLQWGGGGGSNLTLDVNTNVTGAIALNGGTTIGDASGDSFTINSSAVSIPNGLNFDSNTLVIDATNNRVGIGTSSPAEKLEVRGGITANDGGTQKTYLSNAGEIELVRTGGDAYIDFSTSTAEDFDCRIQQASNGLRFYTGGNGSASERMFIDSSGNVGIGTSSPTALLHVNGGSRLGNSEYNLGSIEINIQGTGDRNTFIDFHSSGTPASVDLSARIIRGAGVNGEFSIVNSGSGNIIFDNNNAERMRIDSSGNLLIGTTSNPANAKTFIVGINYWATQIQCINSGGALLIGNVSGTSAYNAASFYNNGFNSGVGSITVGGSTTSYNTSSDYRLKENIVPMVGALATVSALKPVTYKWKSDGSNGQGFIAHELAEVVPDCVTGEKDAVNEDGTIKAQGIDTSFLIATLTAAIQEQQSIINDLKSRIETLESK